MNGHFETTELTRFRMGFQLNRRRPRGGRLSSNGISDQSNRASWTVQFTVHQKTSTLRPGLNVE